MTFAQRLRELRDKVGLSEAKLASESGVAFGTLHDYGLGRRIPSFPNVVKLAKALGEDCTAFAECEDMAAEEPAGRKAPRKPAGPRRKGEPRRTSHHRAGG